METLIVSGIIKGGVMAYKHVQGHCSHCKGDGPCKCEFGCRTKSMTKCFAYFKDNECASCRSQGIKGSLFRCRECKSCDLCATCYNQQAHRDHDFVEFPRKGAEPIFHQAQSKITATITHMPIPQPPQCVPITVIPAVSQQSAPPPALQQQQAYARISTPNLPTYRPNLVNQPPQQFHHSMPNLHQKVVTCDLCHQDGTRTSHLKCATCADFDLCESCHGTAFHGHHPFYQFKEAQSQPLVHPAMDGRGALHPRVCCDSCHAEDIRGSRYKCAECAEFDLCQTCYGNTNAHNHHAFKRYDKPRGAAPVYLPSKLHGGAILPIHANVMCDGCKAEDLVGSRFQCATCRSFDLCNKCWKSGVHGHHSFLEYKQPNTRPTAVAAIHGCSFTSNSSSSSSSFTVSPPSSSHHPSSFVVHKGVQCDCCGMEDIRGARYCCQDCAAFDMCSRCYDGQSHGHHGFKRYDRPGTRPLFISPQAPPSAPGEDGIVSQFADELAENAVESLAEQFGEALNNYFTGGDEDPAGEILEFGYDDGFDC